MSLEAALKNASEQTQQLSIATSRDACSPLTAMTALEERGVARLSTVFLLFRLCEGLVISSFFNTLPFHRSVYPASGVLSQVESFCPPVFSTQAMQCLRMYLSCTNLAWLSPPQYSDLGVKGSKASQ
jgi:hypothetical protein